METKSKISFSDDQLSYIAEKEPHKLFQFIKDDKLSNDALAISAESLAKCKNSNLARNILLPLLNHQDPLVREASIYGLEKHFNQDVLSSLEVILEIDNNEIVKQCAKDLLSRKLK